MSVPVGSGGTDGPDLGCARSVGVLTGLRVSLKVAVCWEDGLGKPWVVGVVGTASPLLVAEGAELFAVLDNPAFEGVDPVGVGEAVAEFRGLSEASCNLPGRTAAGRSGRRWPRVGAIGGRRRFPRVRQPRASPAARWPNLARAGFGLACPSGRAALRRWNRRSCVGPGDASG